MSIRSDLCAQRAVTVAIDAALAEIEQQLASRNAAHLVSKARSMARATGTLISQALEQPLTLVADEPADRAA